MRKIVDIIMIILFIIVLCFTGYKVWTHYKEYKDYEKVKEITQKEREVQPDKKKKSLQLNINWKNLKKTNKDCIAWIYIPDSPIDYPVVQCHDTDYCLYHLFDGTWSYKGCIFVSRFNNGIYNDPNTIIYGHNTYDDTMFAKLNRYQTQEWYEDHKYVYIATPEEGTVKYEVFSAYVTRDMGDAYEINIDKDMIEQYYRQSWIDTDVSWDQLKKHNKVVTLSTCKGYTNDHMKRVVVHLIRAE